MGSEVPAAGGSRKIVRVTKGTKKLIRAVKRDPRIDAILAKSHEDWAVYRANNVDPIIEVCRPIVGTVHDDFLDDRKGWADAVIKAVERERGNPGAVRLFDGERFARTREDAILRLAWLMAYFHPKDNPLIEAQGERARALGIFDRREDRSRVNVEDGVVLSLAILLRDLDPHEREQTGIGPGLVFPNAIGLEKAKAELARWRSLVLGRDVGEPVATEADENALSITDDDRDIFRYLLERYPTARVQAEIEAATDIPRRRVGTRLKYLREHGWIHRPHGERSGEVLTPKGQQFAETLAH